MANFWLMKAEPDSRIVKGKDVKFSVDDFEACGETAWEGVRNFEARNIMRDRMKIGDKVLFYHSNTKVPGVAGLAEISKEAYADYTAWDDQTTCQGRLLKHRLLQKTDQANPKWFMVSVRFQKRLPHLVPLHLLKFIKDQKKLPDVLQYLDDDARAAISEMQLLNRGRLSVQSVTEGAYNAVAILGEKGGWESIIDEKGKLVKAPKAKDAHSNDESQKPATKSANSRKRKKLTETEEEPEVATKSTRRSQRRKKED
ncbi:DUF55-domain-containing protein [Sistotremastrum suecicum HHB10207 ss-3]|uniref:DUF55-domain-containing protein n=1 Tax=Sistotremastrum suecicum HHB10207 ss-3 TaxID=1314776 RepID=A0A165ZH15_9AGAM|nr:DUF55-domain-containing protein [Sistotremastrum suecicum HHB10207 ss-3]